MTTNQNNTQNPIRLAVVGGRRGGAFKQALSALQETVILTSVCDLSETVLTEWKENYPGVNTYTDYDKLLEDPNLDAVLLATPLVIHAKQAVKALRAGKHVLSEVIACHTLEDAWELVEAVEQTGLTYMMAENYCYMRPNKMVENMVHQGVFGKVSFVEGAYLHDCRSLTNYPDGSLTWRGELNRDHNAMNYPTHSLGPLAQWLGINRTDELDYMSTYSTRGGSMAKYFHEQYGDSHPGSKPAYWQQGDATVSTIRTKSGIVISLRLDWASSRPHNMVHYGLQGTEGAYLAPRHDKEDPLVWIEGRSPGYSVGLPGQEHAEWESLWNYADEFEHPLWKRSMKEAEQAGHGGGDFFVIDEFVSSIRENRLPAVDVYDAVTWSSVFPLSAQSIANNGQTVAFPDFMKNRKAKK
ncbi:Gfo/Idh/MocA family oxidoreductase [Paenibacillus eucommiae]|uniref:Dehydrogenase n=1 Tax=Paenibacillus eucommiae TaxID=1355755 RepID=A0ABS4IT82_9BACL|nr:Gfo/Idh/MocA family oxidoreductase [Paenibacillus eucommiae]MBP1990773.1 putative dehydrogenase [Paenibacillus eucommiae]